MKQRPIELLGLPTRNSDDRRNKLRIILTNSIRTTVFRKFSHSLQQRTYQILNLVAITMLTLPQNRVLFQTFLPSAIFDFSHTTAIDVWS